MSFQNHLDQKRARRTPRAQRKQQAAKRFPFAGYITTRRIVLGQRYLAVHGLPFSPSIAAVAIGVVQS